MNDDAAIYFGIVGMILFLLLATMPDNRDCYRDGGRYGTELICAE